MVACLGFAIWRFPSPVDGNGDTIWLIIVAERLLDGARLYADVFETNPPMSVLLYVPAVWSARQFGGVAEWWLVGHCLALAGLAVLLLARVLPLCGIDKQADRAALLAVTVFVLVVMPSRSFGQREHIAVMGLVPALALMAARHVSGQASGWCIQIGSGVLAGLAICIKPHFALSLVLPLLALLAVSLRHEVGRRPFADRLAPWFSTANLTAALVFAGYVALVLIAFPDFRGVMVERVSLLYVPDRLSVPELLSAPATVLMVALLMLAGMLRPARLSVPGLVMAAGALGCVAAFLVQGKGWAYQLLPGVSLAIIGFAAIAIGAVRNSIEREAPRSIGLVVVAACVVAGILAPQVFSRYDTPRQLEALLARHVERPTLLAATVSLEVLPMVRRLGGTWAGRSASLWMTNTGSPQLVAGDSSPRQERIRSLVRLDRDLFVDDAVGKRPDVLLFSAPNPEQDFLVWALGDPRMASLITQYHDIGEADAMRVFVRTDLLLQSLRLTRLGP